MIKTHLFVWVNSMNANFHRLCKALYLLAIFVKLHKYNKNIMKFAKRYNTHSILMSYKKENCF